MPTNIDKVPRYILMDAARNLGWRENDYKKDYEPENDPIEPYLEKLAKMHPKQVFNAYCNWNALVGWGSQLWDIVENLQNANKEY